MFDDQTEICYMSLENDVLSFVIVAWGNTI